ncbi:hypothetical protein E2C01_053147 [Portunus trituberculatus]|uniref:Uncharacterized protein n=1 Tax=Portunus trituberculatus TaxID=210409 RepID=A0A5B7GJI9_PORTR|nr:hypothetical protein [Portunus trituberculatus]
MKYPRLPYNTLSPPSSVAYGENQVKRDERAATILITDRDEAIIDVLKPISFPFPLLSPECRSAHHCPSWSPLSQPLVTPVRSSWVLSQGSRR